VAGQRGAEEVIQNVLAELELTMALCGARELAELRETRVSS
jgi:isopentenyl diphosphate isomerase/L-lactate dehydrogenase-like FMN-dependent dehydrogenase